MWFWLGLVRNFESWEIVNVISGFIIVENTAQLPCSYSTLGCCSLVDLLPWECCRLHYGKVQSPQLQGDGIVVQGGCQAPWTHWNPLEPTGSSGDPPPIGLAYRGRPSTIVTSAQPTRCPGIFWIPAST